VLVQRHLGHARGGDDGIDANGMNALGVEEVAGGGEESVLGLGWRLGGTGHTERYG
jgi:hypothetical protein